MTNEINNAPQQQPPHGSSNGISIAGMVVGIIGIVCALVPGGYWIAFILGVLAVVFGAVGRSNAKKAGQKAGPATAGLALGVITIVLGVIMLAACSAVIGAAGSAAEKAVSSESTQQAESAEPAQQAEPAESTESTQQAEPAEDTQQAVSTDVKEALDSYEAFMDECRVHAEIQWV
ncbi:MAG: DUF6591 domain-containing protein [Coriobacteriales bacterium]|jgi:hypothetical protein